MVEIELTAEPTPHGTGMMLECDACSKSIDAASFVKVGKRNLQLCSTCFADLQLAFVRLSESP